MKKPRKIACHRIVFPERQDRPQVPTPSVVEIQSGTAVRWYPLTQELPQTEWLPGEVVLCRDDQGLLRAYYDGQLL